MEKLQVIQNKIYEIRGYKVMLDFDLAEMYQVETRTLNQAVKRNITRFPPDFMFQLANEELEYEGVSKPTHPLFISFPPFPDIVFFYAAIFRVV